KFGTTTFEQFYRTRLAQLKQTGPVLEYNKAFNELYFNVPTMTVDEAYFHYTRGLNIALFQSIKIARITTLDEAQSYVLDLEEALQPCTFTSLFDNQVNQPMTSWKSNPMTEKSNENHFEPMNSQESYEISDTMVNQKFRDTSGTSDFTNFTNRVTQKSFKPRNFYKSREPYEPCEPCKPCEPSGIPHTIVDGIPFEPYELSDSLDCFETFDPNGTQDISKFSDSYYLTDYLPYDQGITHRSLTAFTPDQKSTIENPLTKPLMTFYGTIRDQTMSTLIFPSLNYDVILGQPWIMDHLPQPSWSDYNLFLPHYQRTIQGYPSFTTEPFNQNSQSLELCSAHSFERYIRKNSLEIYLVILHQETDPPRPAETQDLPPEISELINS
ncbi:hypothetical protein IWQ61_010023, partial [Dispira simplex]